MDKKFVPSKKLITKRPNGSIRVQTVNEDPSLTDQQFKEEVDVNTVMSKFRKGVPLPTIRAVGGVFADVSNVGSLLEAYTQIEAAGEAFSQLPARTRERFRNDPRELQAFLEDPANVQESIELGLREVRNPVPPADGGQVEKPAASKRQRASSKTDSESGDD